MSQDVGCVVLVRAVAVMVAAVCCTRSSHNAFELLLVQTGKDCTDVLLDARLASTST